MEGSVFERFVAIAQRELAADDVRLLEVDEVAPTAANVVVARLPDGRHVVASFGEPPKDREALARRLGILAGTFGGALVSRPSERSRARQPIVTSLHEELKALALRAQAHDVVVIDGDSPVVWGCASVPARPRARTDMLLRDVSDRELASHDEPSGPSLLHAVPPAPDESGRRLEPTAPTGDLRVAPEPPESTAALTGAPSADESGYVFDDGEEPEITRRAIAHIRELPTLDQLHKGKHLRHVSREGACYLVLSFSSIYLLCLVFDGEFDELRAERAAQESLPRVERLVLALPPLHPDPEPVGGAVALRRPRRR